MLQIVHDITYISEPFFRDGVFSQAVDYVTAQGVSYFTAAGNYSTKSWQGTFSSASPPPGVTGEAHNFAGGGGTDIYQSITLEQGNYTVVLQWDDGTPGLTTNTDLDIYLTNENGNLLFGFNRVNTGGAPVDGVVRNKPDIAAPNGVNTTADLGGFNIDGDPFPNFFGTSAAAPHAAGLAALILEARNNFYNDSFSPAQMRSLLTMANPSPLITGLVYDTTLVPGQDSILVFVSGHYLTEDSEIWFNGQPLATGTAYVSDTLITGIIPVFEERYPAITVYNPPLPQTNGTDGGFSNALYFTNKRSVVITIDDTIKKYGEILPEFTANYFVEGIDGITSLEEEGFSPAETGRITGIPLLTVADALSTVGLWAITTTPDDPLNPASIVAATDSLDIAPLEEYNFDVENGLLFIEKMDLFIQPRDTTITYGDTFTSLGYLFVYNQDASNPENNVIIAPGTYLSQNFNITYGLGTLTVLPAVATVTADNQVIYAGDSLPAFTATFSGFVNGETDTVVTELSFAVDPDYTGNAGTYQVIPSAIAENYVFTPVNCTLYVNPFGPGTQHIKIKLICVETLSEPDRALTTSFTNRNYSFQAGSVLRSRLAGDLLFGL